VGACGRVWARVGACRVLTRNGALRRSIRREKEAACYSGLKIRALILAIPAVVVMVVVARIIGVIAMMVVVMMIAVPSSGWHGTAGRDCANNS